MIAQIRKSEGESRRAACLRIVPDLAALVAGPKFSPWQARQNSDGSWCLAKFEIGGTAVLTFGHFNERLIAVNLAREENERDAR